MTKEKLEKEAVNWLRKYLLCCNCEKKCNCIDSNSYCEEQVLKAYVDSAEPREKRITELEQQIENIYANHCGNCNRNILNTRLKKENAELSEQLLVVSEQLRLAQEMPYSAVKKFAEEKTQEQLTKAVKHLKDLVYVVELGKNELAAARILAEAKEFLKETK